MANNPQTGSYARELVLGVLVVILGATLLKFADLPTRVSVVETKVNDVKDDVADIKATVHQIANTQMRAR